MKKTLLFVFITLVIYNVGAQGLLSEKNKFTKQDTLRGSITPEREWWDLGYYHLDISVDPENKFIKGKTLLNIKYYNLN